MSNEITVSITVKISENFAWLNVFIQSLYEMGEIYTHPFDEPRKWNGEIKLLKKDACIYFERYIRELQSDMNLPPIVLVVEEMGYPLSIYSKPGYLRLTMYLFSDGMYKYETTNHPNFQHYIHILMRLMRNFNILAMFMWYDDDYIHDEGHRIEGKWVGLKIQEPQPKTSLQILDTAISAELTEEVLQRLVQRAAFHGYQLFPADISGALSYTAQEIINKPSFKKPFPEYWIYICDDTHYEVRITRSKESSFLRLLFRTPECKNTPHIDRLVSHALNILSENILEQIISFDSRYNYFTS